MHRGAIFTALTFANDFATRNNFNFSSCSSRHLAIHRNIGLPIKVRSRAHDLSYNRISERLESAKRLHRYLNFADDGNHARLDTSIARFVGFLRLGYFTIGSNPPRCGGQDRVLLVFSVDSKPRISRSPSDRVYSLTRFAGLEIVTHLPVSRLRAIFIKFIVIPYIEFNRISSIFDIIKCIGAIFAYRFLFYR